MRSDDAEQQADTIALLEDMRRHARESAAPVSTHISRIYFVGDTVYKLKRAVRTPYLDYSKPELRLHACQRELELNRRTSPALYKAVRRVTRDGDRIVLDGAGELVDALVEMTRFDEACLFDTMARRGALTAGHMDALAARLVVFHAQAPISRIHGGAAGASAILDINEQALAQTFLCDDDEARRICAAMRDEVTRHAQLLDDRRAAGHVRHCHGDLTLRNICLLDGEPTPFDCLEFSDSLATIDVLYDLAFPVMDLCHRGHTSLANALFNRYLDRCNEADGLVLLPLFIAMRAVVRAHVMAATAGNVDVGEQAALVKEARDYLRVAAGALSPRTPRLIAIGGFSGSGKSTVAAILAPQVAPLPGARILSSDRIRKQLHGVDPTARLPAGAYTPEVSAHVYARARRETEACLKASWPVIVESVFDLRDSRDALRAVSEAQNVAFQGLWLATNQESLAARIDARRNDPSDADTRVLDAQIDAFAQRGESMDWTQIDASRPAVEVASSIMTTLASA